MMPTYMKCSDPIAITLLVIASIGIVLSIIVVCFFYSNRNTKLIKASGKELSGVTMLGILMAFVTVFRLMTKPTNTGCFLWYGGFNVSVTLIFCPLFLKTNRVYRIFEGGKKGVKKTRCTGFRFQISSAVTLVLLQVRRTLSKLHLRSSNNLRQSAADLQAKMAASLSGKFRCKCVPRLFSGAQCFHLPITLLIAKCSLIPSLFANGDPPQLFQPLHPSTECPQWD